MYSTKVSNTKCAIDAGRYISINDPYNKDKKLPARWKSKQFEVPQQPGNAGDGYFGYSGKSFSYQSDPYQEQRPYLKQQPPDKRKLGFGTHDASRRDEFSQTIRTEQYRETLQKELRKSSKQFQDNQDLLNKQTKKHDFVANKKEITRLYDVGVNVSSSFPCHVRRRRSTRNLIPRMDGINSTPSNTA